MRRYAHSMVAFLRSIALTAMMAAALTTSLIGCPGDDPDTNPDDPDMGIDGTDAPDVADVEDGGDGADGAEVEDGSDTDDGSDGTDGTPLEPRLSCQVRLFDGLTDFGPPVAVTLSEDDEPSNYKASPGFQVDLRANTVDVPDGTTVRLFVDGAEADTVALNAPDAIPGQVGFTNVTLTNGTTQVWIEATVPTDDGAVTARCQETNFTIDSQKCNVSLAPAADECVSENLADDGTTRVAFTVTNDDGLCDRAYLKYTVAGQAFTTDPVDLASGEATIAVTVSNELADDLPVAVAAVVQSSDFSGRTNETEAVTYQVDVAPPEPSIVGLADGATVALGMDADQEPDNGIQLSVSGTVFGLLPTDTDSITVTASNGATATVTPSGAAAPYNWKAEITFDENAADAWVEVSATDSCGNTGTTRVENLAVVTSQAVLAIQSPTPGATLWAKDDQDPSSALVYQTTFTVQAVDIAFPATLSVRCGEDVPGGAPKAQVGTLVVDEASVDGLYAVPASINTTGGKTAWVCNVTDDGVNPSASAEVAITVALPAPQLQIQSPVDGKLTNASSVTVTGGAVNLNGMMGEITVSDLGGDVFSIAVPTVSGGAFSWLVPLTVDGVAGSAALDDGVYQLTVSIADAFGNDPCAQASSVCSTSVMLDASSPVLAFVAPSQDIIDPDVDPDTSTAPGFQTLVTVTVDDGGMEPGTEVCISNTGAGQMCAVVADGASSVTFDAVTLQPGINTLQAEATDAAGNVAVAVQKVVTLDSDAPIVAILQPAGDTSTATTTIDVTVKVSKLEGGPETDAVVSILVDGEDSGATGTHTGDGEYTATGVPLGSFGVHTVAAAASVNSGPTGVSSTISVNAKEDPPTIGITNVADNAVYNAADGACALGQSNCVLDVTCSGTNLDDGSSATLNWNCGAGIQSLPGTVDDGAVTFESVNLTNNSTCTLSCEGVDAGTQQVATSPTHTVSVDRTAPVFGAYLKPSNNSLIFVDDESADDGFQYSVQLRVSGVEQGQIITLEAAVQGGESTEQQHVVATSVPNGQFVTIYFAQQTYAQGIVTFTASVADKAGNPAEEAVKTVQIVSEEPLIRISQPAFSASPCSVDSDCDSGELCLDSPNGQRCGLGWGVSSDTTLFIKTKNIPTLLQNQVRICSDNPAYAAEPACSASGDGFHQVLIVSASGDDHTVDLGSAVEGIHNFVAEGKLNDDGTLWVSSTGASTIEDQLRTVKVDIDPPSVTSLSSPDDTEPLGCLNVAEGNGAYDLQVQCDQDGSVEVFLGTQSLGAQAATGGQPVTFVDKALPEAASVTVSAVCTDAVGNSSAALPYQVEVDVTAPTLGFDKPSTSPLLAGAGLDVELLSDEVNAFVSLQDGATPIGSSIVEVDGVARFPHETYNTLSDGEHSLSAAVSDGCGNTTNATTSVTVDTSPPTIAFDSPVSGVELTDGDDASAQGGFQVNVSSTVGGDATSWELVMAANCQSDYTGCSATSTVGSGSLSDGQQIADTLVTVPIFKTPDFAMFTLTVWDAAGNATSVQSNVQITLSSCSLAFDGLPSSGFVSNALCPTAGTDCASVDIDYDVVLVGACAAITTIDLYEGETLVESVPVSGATASFSRTFTHDTQVSLDARGQGSELSTGAQVFDVDLADPVPAFTATTIGAFDTPASGDTVSWNVSDDQSASAGLQIALRVDVTDSGLGGGQVTQLQAEGTATTTLTPTPSLPAAISGTSFGLNLTNITVPDGQDIVVRVTSKDAAGNTADSTFTYSADSVRPAAVALSLAGTGRRAPSATLSWTSVADNGATGAAADSYLIRYSLQPISPGTFETACDAASIVGAADFPTPAEPGETETYTVTGPDQRDPTDPCHFVVRADGAPYYFAVAAVDAAGNRGPVTAGAVVESSDLSLRYAKLGIGGTLADSDFDKRISAIGDVNNDGFADFLVGGNVSFGACIFYGSAQETVPDLIAVPVAGTTEEGPNWQCLLDKDELGNLEEHRAGHISHNVGDVNGDGLQDFAIPAGRKGYPVAQQVRIYFGVDGGKVSYTPSVVITNFAPDETSAIARFDGGGNFNGDTNDHDGNSETAEVPVADIVIGSRRKFCNPTCDGGRAFVVPGNPNWTSETVIDFSNPADLVANNVITFVVPSVPTGVDPRFGAQAHFVGDLLPDAGASYDDIVVTADDPVENTRAVVLRGRPLSGAVVRTVSYDHDGTGDEDATSVELLADDGQNNFGASANITGADVNGDGLAEVMIGHTKNTVSYKRLYVFDGQAIRDAEGDTLIMGVPINPDNSIAQTPVGDSVYVSPVGAGSVIVGTMADTAFVGDVTNRGTGPGRFAIGYRDTSDPGMAYVRFNTSSDDIGFGIYPWADLVFDDPFSPGNPVFAGRDIRGIGDFNGDGLA